MNRFTMSIGVAILAALAGCAKKEAPQQLQVDDEDVSETVTRVQPAPAPQPDEPKDRSEAAAGMIASIDPGPQCQLYRDELEAMGKTPGPVKELSAIFVQAYEAGCGKKKPQ